MGWVPGWGGRCKGALQWHWGTLTISKKRRWKWLRTGKGGLTSWGKGCQREREQKLCLFSRSSDDLHILNLLVSQQSWSRCGDKQSCRCANPLHPSGWCGAREELFSFALTETQSSFASALILFLFCKHEWQRFRYKASGVQISAVGVTFARLNPHPLSALK